MNQVRLAWCFCDLTPSVILRTHIEGQDMEDFNNMLATILNRLLILIYNVWENNALSIIC